MSNILFSAQLHSYVDMNLHAKLTLRPWKVKMPPDLGSNNKVP